MTGVRCVEYYERRPGDLIMVFTDEQFELPEGWTRVPYTGAWRYEQEGDPHAFTVWGRLVKHYEVAVYRGVQDGVP